MKTLQDMIKDLTGVTVEQNKINEYLKDERLDLKDVNLSGADLWGANLIEAALSGANLNWTDLWGADLKNIEITKKQLDQLIVIEDDE
ncbi:pentapeptide repeat-containing protein [Spiroplasma phoeniceum]|nr:pentapeptide repeat-containing protein [Spiroplasma phoeniceum]